MIKKLSMLSIKPINDNIFIFKNINAQNDTYNILHGFNIFLIDVENCEIRTIVEFV